MNIIILDCINSKDKDENITRLLQYMIQLSIPTMINLLIRGYFKDTSIDYKKYIITIYSNSNIHEYHLEKYQLNSVIDCMCQDIDNFLEKYYYKNYDLFLKNNVMYNEKRSYGDSPIYINERW